MLKYGAAAAALGLGWFVILLVPRMPREFLLAHPLQNALLLVGSSVAAAFYFRRFIMRSESLRGDLVRAMVIPYVACILYLVLAAAVIWIRSLLFGGLANAHDTGSLLLWGFIAALLAFPLIVPYGLLCQIAMHRVHDAATDLNDQWK